MERRVGLWFSGAAALLAVALVAAPIWDFWRYRTLRSPIGGTVPVGVILPMRAPAPVPLPDPRASDALRPAVALSGPDGAGAPVAASPAAAVTHGIAPASSPAPPASSATAAGLPARARRGASPEIVEGSADAGRTSVMPRGDAPRLASNAAEPASAAQDPRAGHDQRAGADPGAGAGVGSVVITAWPAPPVSEGEPQPAPPPLDGPPPPRPVDPRKISGDPPANPVSIPSLTLVPPAGTVYVGGDVTISVRISGAQNVSSVPFHVTFDPGILEFKSATAGPAVGSGLQPILLASVSPARPGDVAVGLSLVETSGLLQGSGTVLRLQFRAVAAGASPLAFDRASIRGKMSEALQSQFHGTTVEVR